jgi:hypothetical protein
VVGSFGLVDLMICEFGVVCGQQGVMAEEMECGGRRTAVENVFFFFYGSIYIHVLP